MRHLLARLAAVAVILCTVSCTDDGADFTWLRAMHAMPDAPAVRVEFENYVFRQALNFGDASAEAGESVLDDSGPTARMTAVYLGTDGQAAESFLELDVPVAINSISTVILAGSFDAAQPIVVVSPRRERPLSSLYFQFAHAAPALGALDVYVTAPDTELSATAPLTTVDPLEHSDSVETPFGELRIRLAVAGTLDVVMDSGELNFAEQVGSTGPGAEWLFAVAPSVTAGPSPVQLIGSSGRNRLLINDAGTTATVRALHALAGASPVDLVAATEPETTLAGGVEFGTRSPLVSVPGEELEVEFRLAGQPAEVLATDTISFRNGTEYALYLAGSSEAPSILAFETPSRSIASQGRLRIAHVASGSEFFSVYLSDTEEAPAAENRVALDLRYADLTNYLAREPGDYFITFTRRFFESPSDAAEAEETVVLGPVPLQLVGGDVYTYAIFPPEVEGEAETITQFDDLLP